MATTSTNTAPDTRAAPSRRADLRDDLAAMLQSILPRHLTVYGADVDLFAVDAAEAAEELIEALDGRGHAIVRRAAP